MTPRLTIHVPGASTNRSIFATVEQVEHQHSMTPLQQGSYPRAWLPLAAPTKQGLFALWMCNQGGRSSAAGPMGRQHGRRDTLPPARVQQ